MNKWKKIAACLTVGLVAILSVAAFTGFNYIKITPGANDDYALTVVNSSGTVLFSISTAGVIDASSVGITDVTGGVTAGEIADVTRDIRFDLAGAHVDGGNDVDDASAPNITTLDNVPAILWDNSGETAAVQWTFQVPSDYSTGMVFYAMISSNDASGTGTKLDWAITKNTDATAFGSPTAQDLVESTESALSTKNDILTLTPDATGAALFTSGAVITLEVFNASTNDDDLELKAIWGEYTATQ